MSGSCAILALMPSSARLHVRVEAGTSATPQPKRWLEMVQVIESEPAERLRGQISHVLRTRLACLPETEADALCEQPTLGEALGMLVTTLHGVFACVVEEPGDGGLRDLQATRVYYCLDGVADHIEGDLRGAPAGPDRMVSIHFNHRDADTWANAALAASPETCRALRFDLLHGLLTMATVLRDPIDVRLTRRYPDTLFSEIRWADLSAALTLWWHARQRHGYPPETAATMLHLILDPTVAAKVTFDPHGGLPVLAPPATAS